MANSRKNNTTLKHLETEAFAIKFKTTCGEKYWVPVDIARKLERERDEALSQIVQAECRAERFCQERDEARSLLKSAQSSLDAIHLEVGGWIKTMKENTD